MPRPIDADALRKAMYHEAFEKDSDEQRWDSGCWIRYKMFARVLDSMPTVDVHDRKVGEWIWMGDKGDSRFMCSVCKGKENVPTIMGKPIVWDFCPNCGARMKGESDADD